MALFSAPLYAENGVGDDEIRLGAVLDLEGRSSALGQNMLKGMQAALKDQVIAGKKLILLSENDSYTPDKTVAGVKKLIEQDMFLFMGNVGTPTAKVALPLLEEKGIPALGFFTGSGILRPDKPLIVNYRASYRQETEAVIKSAMQAGVKPAEVCAYVQNDAYGMSGIQGISAALRGQKGVEQIRGSLEEILQKTGDNPKRNNIGPVGVYVRNTFRAREGYDSLKAWEKQQGVSCKLVVTVGSYSSIGHFIAYANGKGENWVYSAVSFTGAENLLQILQRFEIKDRVLISQVVPFANSSAPLVTEAGTALGDDFNLISLEGYIVGRMLLYALSQLETENKALTRENLLGVFAGQTFNLDGLNMDFSQDNQGSDFVAITKLQNDKWTAIRESDWQRWYK
ncbi:MAG: ABC transporter substrate-binding protein [Thiolinea sp.]